MGKDVCVFPISHVILRFVEKIFCSLTKCELEFQLQHRLNSTTEIQDHLLRMVV